jgi:limonene-1,2-epoxide hydrolase
MTPEEVVTAFVARINSHDSLALSDLMTDDHVFVDALDNRISGRAAMRDAWRQYFAMVPDYWIRLDALYSSQRGVGAFGRAGGTYAPTAALASSNRWEVPAAWRAEVQGDRVALWQVYADNLPIRRLMGVEKA